MPGDWADRLDLPPMVAVNEDARGTAYTVSVDAADRQSTGISASDRAHTLNVLANPASTPASVRPGHILPLRAVDGGVRERGGHTEAAVELMRLAGLKPVAGIAEIVAEDGSMMRLPGSSSSASGTTSPSSRSSSSSRTCRRTSPSTAPPLPRTSAA